MHRELKNFRDADNDELSVIKWSDGTATFSVMARNGVVGLNAEQVQELIECLKGCKPVIVDDRDKELKIRERLAGIVAEMVSGVEGAHPVLSDIRIGHAAYLFIRGLIDQEEGRL